MMQYKIETNGSILLPYSIKARKDNGSWFDFWMEVDRYPSISDAQIIVDLLKKSKYGEIQ